MAHSHISIGGYDTIFETPANYSSVDTPCKWVIFEHGTGVDVTTDNWDEIINTFVTHGYVFVAPMTGVNAWGNQVSIDNNLTVYNYIKENYNVESQAILVGHSMGGLIALNSFVRYPVNYKCIVALYPESDLDAPYQPKTGNTDFSSEINTAFGCSSDTYAVLTSGYNPWSRFQDYADADLHMQIWHGSLDVVVNPNQSTGFRDGVNVLAGNNNVEVRIVEGGAHDSDLSETVFLAEVFSYLSTFINEVPSVKIKVGNDLRQFIRAYVKISETELALVTNAYERIGDSLRFSF